MRKTCLPCTSKTPQLTNIEISSLLEEIPSYDLQEIKGMNRISKVYAFKDFTSALSFTNDLAQLSEEENHHPQIILEWGKVQVSWWTHAIGGLDTNDFVMATKTEQLFTHH